MGYWNILNIFGKKNLTPTAEEIIKYEMNTIKEDIEDSEDEDYEDYRDTRVFFSSPLDFYVSVYKELEGYMSSSVNQDGILYNLYQDAIEFDLKEPVYSPRGTVLSESYSDTPVYGICESYFSFLTGNISISPSPTAKHYNANTLLVPKVNLPKAEFPNWLTDMLMRKQTYYDNDKDININSLVLILPTILLDFGIQLSMSDYEKVWDGATGKLLKDGVFEGLSQVKGVSKRNTVFFYFDTEKYNLYDIIKHNETIELGNIDLNLKFRKVNRGYDLNTLNVKMLEYYLSFEGLKLKGTIPGLDSINVNIEKLLKVYSLHQDTFINIIKVLKAIEDDILELSDEESTNSLLETLHSKYQDLEPFYEQISQIVKDISEEKEEIRKDMTRKKITSLIEEVNS